MAKKPTTDARADEVMDDLNFAYSNVDKHWEQIEQDINAFDNIVDSSAWPTMSEVPIPFFYIAILQALPFAYEYLLGHNSRFVELIPQRGGISEESVQRVEEKLSHTLLTKMGLKQDGLLSLIDAYIGGVGYGLVEPQYVTPQHEVLLEALFEGEAIEQDVALVPGQPVLSEAYRYIEQGQVIPMPGVRSPQHGAHFLIDFYDEDDFRDLFRNNQDLSGDPEVIIQETKDLNFNGHLTRMQYIIKNLGTRDLQLQSEANAQSADLKVSVPVIKYFQPRHHTWVANGTQTIREQEATLETMRSPLIKWQIFMHSNRWFTPGICTNSREMMNQTNAFNNALIDVLAYHLNPVRVLNMRSLGNKAPPREPYSDIFTYDDNENPVSYLEQPRIDPALLETGSRLERWMNAGTGQNPEFHTQGTAGIVRGGSGALEALMQGTLGRERFAAAIAEMGGLQDTAESTLLLGQLLMPRDGEQFTVERFRDRGDGSLERYWEELRVTRQDIRHAFNVKVNLRSKLRNSSADAAIRQAWFDRLSQDPFTNPRELRRWGPAGGDEDLYRKLFKSDEEMRRIEQENRQLEIMERLQGGQRGARPSMPRGEQAATGAAAAQSS